MNSILNWELPGSDRSIAPRVAGLLDADLYSLAFGSFTIKIFSHGSTMASEYSQILQPPIIFRMEGLEDARRERFYGLDRK
jgi:hypothetical protein